MIDKDTWRRYIDDECAPEEKQEVLKLLKQLAPGEMERLLESGWDDQAPPMPADLASRVHARLLQKIQQESDRTERGKRPIPALRLWRMPHLRWATAACVVLLAGIGVRLLFRGNPSANAGAFVPAAREIRNLLSVTQRAALPDGSRVWLTPHSVIVLTSDYGQKDRILRLRGEGYFEVASDPTRPFVVEAGGLQTTVLGTHFNIESYPGESSVKVSLSEGKVVVSGAVSHDSAIFLTPGIRLTYQQGRMTTDHFLPSEEAAWKRGSFVLNDLTLTDALTRLSSRFGKTVLFKPADFSGKRFSAIYEHPDWKIILENMAFVQGFRYHITNDSITIIK